MTQKSLTILTPEAQNGELTKPGTFRGWGRENPFHFFLGFYSYENKTHISFLADQPAMLQSGGLNHPVWGLGELRPIHDGIEIHGAGVLKSSETEEDKNRGPENLVRH